MQWIQWEYPTPYGFTLRGSHTPPRGLPLLHVLHGNGFCSRMYQPLLEMLSAHFDLFLSDAQGHGDSDHGGAFIGWNQSAEEAQNAFEAHRSLFGHVPCYGLGHSFGGVLTALINSQSNSPFEKVVLLDPVLFTPSLLASMQLLTLLGLYKNNPMAKKARRRKQSWANQQEAWDYFYQRGLFKGWHDSALVAYLEHALEEKDQALHLKCHPSREADIFASYPKGLWRALKKPCSPTLLVIAENTYGFVQTSALRFAKQNPSVTLDTQQGGHCFVQENPSQSALKIIKFLK